MPVQNLSGKAFAVLLILAAVIVGWLGAGISAVRVAP